MSLLVSSLSESAVYERLAGAPGLAVRTGPYTFGIETRIQSVGKAIRRLYGDFPLADEASTFVDFRVGVRRPAGWRSFWKPQVSFVVDGQDPFNPLPGDQGFPLLEWGLNYCVYGLCHQHLTIHAAVLEQGGRAVILPAPSGSGKSTLCAGLLFSGWRLLSDELTLIDPHDGTIIPMPRPVSLKNESIEVISAFAPEVDFGSRVHETTKGSVAHFRPPTASVLESLRNAAPGWIVLPRFEAGCPARLVPLERSKAFMALVENAFNYDVFGVEGFHLLASVVDRSDCYRFEYGNLADAVEVFNGLTAP